VLEVHELLLYVDVVVFKILLLFNFYEKTIMPLTKTTNGERIDMKRQKRPVTEGLFIYLFKFTVHL